MFCVVYFSEGRFSRRSYRSSCDHWRTRSRRTGGIRNVQDKEM